MQKIHEKMQETNKKNPIKLGSTPSDNRDSIEICSKIV